METPLLKRRLNPFLLVSTVLVLSLLAGLSVVYQSQLNDLVSSKKDLKTRLDQKENVIQSLKDERSNLSTQVSDLNQSLEKTNSIISSKESRISTLETRLDNKTRFIENRTRLIQRLDSQLGNETVRAQNLSQSLSVICSGGSNLTETAKQECNEWS